GLMAAPEILLIDELSLGLAPVVVQQIVSALVALKKSGLTILLVEQNVQLALALSDYAYVIAGGPAFLQQPLPQPSLPPHITHAKPITVFNDRRSDAPLQHTSSHIAHLVRFSADFSEFRSIAKLCLRAIEEIGRRYEATPALPRPSSIRNQRPVSDELARHMS